MNIGLQFGAEILVMILGFLKIVRNFFERNEVSLKIDSWLSVISLNLVLMLPIS
jgi:hypothetical protein